MCTKRMKHEGCQALRRHAKMPKGAMRLFPLALVAAAISFACGASPQAPVAAAPVAASAPAADDSSKKGGAEDAAKKQAAAVDALTEDEAKKGACDPDHKAALEKLLAEIETSMKAKAGDDGKPLGMQTVEKRVVPLSSRPSSIQLTVSGRGTQLDVLVLGVREATLDVLANGTPATTMRSPFQRTVTASPPTIELAKIGTGIELQSDSRQIQIKPGQPLEVRLRGQGCAILAAFHKPN